MKNTIIVILSALLFAAACGGSEPSSTRAKSSGSPTPASTASGDAQSGSEGDEDTTSDASAPEDGGSGDTADGPSGTPTPRPTIPPSVVGPPQARIYEYEVSGTRQTPGMAAEEPYPDDALLVWEYLSFTPVKSWVEFTYSKSLEADGMSGEFTIAWRRAGLRYAMWRTSWDDAGYTCRFEPMMHIANAPIRVEDHEPQDWAGTGCTGTTDLAVTKDGVTLTDAKGKTWKDLFLIEEQTDYRLQTLRGTITAKRWFSHDEGIDVRTEIVDEGLATATPYRFEQNRLLSKLEKPDNAPKKEGE